MPAQYASIQAAIDDAALGDVVAVAAGTFHEDLARRPGVVVRGAGAKRTVLFGRVTANGADGAGVQELTLDGSLAGAGADGVSAVSSGLSLQGVTVTRFTGRGVVTAGAAGPARLDGLRVTHCGVGVQLGATSATPAAPTNSVLVFNGGDGVGSPAPRAPPPSSPTRCSSRTGTRPAAPG